jgi:TonB family protein
MSGGVVWSVAIHVGVLLLVVFSEVTRQDIGVGKPGQAGGGGGGGPEVTAYVDISAFVTSSAAPAPSEKSEVDPVEITVQPRLKSIARSTPKVNVWQPVRPELPKLANDFGTSGGPGSGTGIGGGRGGGVGTGVGDNVGPGIGGERAPAYAPEPRSVIYPLTEPPASLEGVLMVVHFWVDARGRVTKVEVLPPIEDEAYLREFIDTMYRWAFYPARMADGRPVEGELVVTYRP